MLGPLHKTVMMKSIAAFSKTRSGEILLHNFHLTNRTKIFLIFFLPFLFLQNYFGQVSVLDTLQKIFYFVLMDPAVGDDISQLLICIFILEEQRVVERQVKYLNKGIECMQAMLRFIRSTWAFELVADGYFKFATIHIFEDKTGSASNTNEIILINCP